MLTQKLSWFFDMLGVEWVMVLLLVLSVLSVAIMVERWLFFRRHAVDIDVLMRAIAGALEVDDRDGALKAALEKSSMEGRVVAAGIRSLDRGADSVQEVMAGALVSERVDYDRYLPFLGTLGNNAPFIGLFGTVLGIISAFGMLGEIGEGVDRAKAIMGSISEALVATAVGLMVAIPAVIAYNQFKGMIKARVSHAEALSHVLLAHLKSTKNEG